MGADVEHALGIAVVGAGGWGRNHVRTWASMPDVALRCVCDRERSTRESVLRNYPSLRCVGDLAEVFEDGSITGVVIATDAPSHVELARRALEADRDVFVEKPLALSASDADQLCELAEKRDRVLMVGHLLLYHAAAVELERLIRAGELGDILYVYTQRVNLGVVRQKENAWWSLAPHDIAMVNFLLGSEPVAVSAQGGTFLQRERKIEDVVFATLGYPNGTLAHVHVSWLDPHKTRRLTVVGSKKMAVFDDGSPDRKLSLFDKGVQLPSAVSYEESISVRSGDIRIPALRMVEPLKRECEAFVEAMRSRKPPTASGRSGAVVVRCLEAGSRSLAAGGHPVGLGSIP